MSKTFRTTLATCALLAQCLAWAEREPSPQGVVSAPGGTIYLARYATNGSNITGIIEPLLHESIQRRGTLDISGGPWLYMGPGIAPAHGEFVSVRGSVAGKTRIIIATNGYLFDTPHRIGNIVLEDFEVVGGKGLLRQSYTNIDAAIGVARSLTRLRVVKYTECAININAVDSPNWQMRNCWFDAASSVRTIHFAHNGLPNSVLFEGCEFGSAQVGIKLRHANDMTLIASAFYHTTPSSPGTPRINIWVQPTLTVGKLFGQTLRIISTKFGNEDWGPGDRKIVFAAEDLSSGSDAGTRFPDFSRPAPGRIYGFYITGNKLSWTSKAVGALIYSMCPDIGYMSSVFGNTWTGSATEDGAGLNVIEWHPALSIPAEPCEFMSMKGNAAFYRNGPQGTRVRATVKGWAPVPQEPNK